MLDWYPPLSLVADETFRCPVGGPLPDSLTLTVRQYVRDERLAADILVALSTMIDGRGREPGASPLVELVVRAGRDTLEVALNHGASREMLVCTLD